MPSIPSIGWHAPPFFLLKAKIVVTFENKFGREAYVKGIRYQ